MPHTDANTRTRRHASSVAYIYTCSCEYNDANSDCYRDTDSDQYPEGSSCSTTHQHARAYGYSYSNDCSYG